MSAAPSVNRSMSALEWSLLVALSVLWGGSYFFVGVAVRELPPLTIVVVRVMLAALALWLVIGLLRQECRLDRSAWRAFLVMGLLNNVVPFVCIVWGQTQVASGVASVLNATAPFFTVIVAHFFTVDDRATPGRVAGVVLGFAGVATMFGASLLAESGARLVPQFVILAAAISYAFAGVYGRRFRTMGVSPLVTAAGQVTASGAMLLPLVLFVDRPWMLPFPSPATIGALASLALLSTALAYILYFRILSTAGATNLILVTFLIPITAIVLGVLVLGEELQLRYIVGMALIGVGLAAIDGRLWKALRRGNPAGT